jgi:hypothetical protein
MAALSAARGPDQLGNYPYVHLWRVPVKAATKIWKGAACVIDAGYLAPARTATGLITAGVARNTFDNSTGAAGAVVGEVERGVFAFNNSSAGDLIAQANVGADCWFVDDQTVALTNGGATRSRAGRIIQIEGGMVYVEIGVP